MSDLRWPRNVVSFWSEIRDHQSLVLRGIGAGWAFWASYAALKGWVLSHFFQNLAIRIPLVFGHGLTHGLFWWVLRCGSARGPEAGGSLLDYIGRTPQLWCSRSLRLYFY